MNHTLYQVHNTINDKIYIGIHSSNKPFLETDYWGSGTHIIRAIKKYGRKAFKRYVMGVYETREELFDVERLIVDQKFIDRNDTYNIILGGSGFASGEQHPQYGTSGTAHHNYQRERTPEFREKVSKATKGKNNPFYGKKHTPDALAKMADASRNRKHTKEWKEHMSKIMTGRVFSHEHKAKISKAMANENNHMYGVVGEQHPSYDVNSIKQIHKRAYEAGDWNTLYPSFIKCANNPKHKRHKDVLAVIHKHTLNT